VVARVCVTDGEVAALEVDAGNAPGVSGGDGVADEKQKVTKGSKSWSVAT
jgi:hypothetical protein